MEDPDPAQAASREDLAECLRQLHIRADTPSLRELDDRTKHAKGVLPGTHLKQVRLGRTNLNDVLLGRKFPRKAFLLTLVQELHVDLEADRRWEQAWDRLAVQYPDRGAEAEVEQLRQQLAAAEEQLRHQAAAAESRADLDANEASALRKRLADSEVQLRQRIAADEAAAKALQAERRKTRKLEEELMEARTLLNVAREQIQVLTENRGTTAQSGEWPEQPRTSSANSLTSVTATSRPSPLWTPGAAILSRSEAPGPDDIPAIVAAQIGGLSSTAAANFLKTRKPALREQVLDLLGTAKAGLIRRHM